MCKDLTRLSDEQLQERYVPITVLPLDRRLRARYVRLNAAITAELKRRNYVLTGV